MRRSTFLRAAAATPLLGAVEIGSVEPVNADNSADPTQHAFYTGGLGPFPYHYRLGANGFEAGVNVQHSEMLGSKDNPAKTSATTVTINPIYLKPATTGGGKPFPLGSCCAKQYANLRVTLEQGSNLPVLQPTQILSWHQCWDFVQAQKNGHGDAVLAQPLTLETGSSDTFTNMPLSNGGGHIYLNFVTGFDPNNTAMTFSRIIDRINPLAAATGPLSQIFGIAASAMPLVQQYENAVLLSLKSIGPDMQFTRVLRGDARQVATHVNAPNAGQPNVLNLPAGGSIFAFVADATDEAKFDDLLSTLASKKQAVQLLKGVEPAIVDLATSKRTSDQSALDPFTIVVLGFTVAEQT